MAKPQGSLYEEIGRRIRQARRSAELTQSELAGSVGISRTSLTNIEKGRQPVYIHVLLRVADALRTNVQFLIPIDAPQHDNPELVKELKGKSQTTQNWVKKVLNN